MRNFNLLKSRTVAVVTGAVVVVGLGTTGATAAGLINSDDIRNNSIAGKDISRNAIGSTELDRNAVKSHHLAPGAIGINDLRPGVQREIDDTTEVNGLRQQVETLQGQVTELEAVESGYEVVGNEVSVPQGEQDFTHTQNCPGDKMAIGGGFKISGDSADNVVLDHSFPGNLTQMSNGSWGATGWTVQLDNNEIDGATEQVVAYAVCATVSN